MPIELILSCMLVEYGIIKSIHYDELHAYDKYMSYDKYFTKIKHLFKKVNLFYVMRGIIITSHNKLDELNESINEKYLYPSKNRDECICVEINIDYKENKYNVLTLYYDILKKKDKKLIEKIYNFLNKIFSNLTNEIRYQTYISFNKLKEILRNKKGLNKEYKKHIDWLFLKYGFGKTNNKTYLQKNRIALLTILRIIKIDIEGFFLPTDLSIKSDFINH